jgi:hypothetical protein
MVNHLRREFNPFQRRISTSTRRGKAYHESVVEGSKDVSHAEYMLSLPHSRSESHILLLLYSHFLLPRLHAQNGNQQNHQTHQNQHLSALLFLPTNSRFSSFVDFKQKRQEKYTTYSKANREAARRGDKAALGQATRLPQNKTSTKKFFKNFIGKTQNLSR